MSKPAWTADINIDSSLAARLIDQQFPQLRGGGAVDPFGVGWDNAAFLVDGHIVFRFPRRRLVAGLIEREIAILPHVASRLPVATSVPTLIGAPSQAYPWMFAGYELIKGVGACSMSLSDAERTALAQPLGQFLRALHALEPAPLVALGLPPDELGRLDHEKRLKMTSNRLPALVQAGAIHQADLITTWLEANPPGPLDKRHWKIVHGDLYARHLVLDAAAHLTGVIDWGDVHHGDPAIDIAIAHLMLPASAHDVFRAAYGGVDERTWTAARYRAMYHAILQLDYGIQAQDDAMRRSGSAALQLLSWSQA